MEPVVKHKILFTDGCTQKPWTGDLICEEPLSIRVQGNPYAVVMRTPGSELAHAAGFCLGEGIVDVPEDIAALSFCDDSDTNVVTITLSETRRKVVSGHMERRQFISQTSCGLCGKELVDELYQLLEPVENNKTIPAAKAVELIDSLSDHQPIRRQTRAVHAAALFSANLKLLAVSEDVGRHNALDKSVGTLFLDRKLAEACVLVLSSRISYELVQKAARARIPIILAVSRPTSLAVSLAEKLGITLACLSKKTGIDIYCGTRRIR